MLVIRTKLRVLYEIKFMLIILDYGARGLVSGTTK